MRKKDVVTLCLILVTGLSAGFFVRYLSLHGYHADTAIESGITIARGVVTKNVDVFELRDSQVTSGVALVSLNNVVLISNSPSIEFASFLGQQVRVEGIMQDGVMAVVAIYPL
ncbi:MAG: hypothetical protein WCI57_01840 [Candidatus Berkelbacteria bacterium]